MDDKTFAQYCKAVHVSQSRHKCKLGRKKVIKQNYQSKFFH